jgi:[protein-PII] uridylyltransferase
MNACERLASLDGTGLAPHYLRLGSNMRINLEKILVHANEKLAVISAATEREEQVEAFKRFLKIETERLRIRHRFGLGGIEIARGRSYLVDMVICRACQLAEFDLHPANADSGCAVVALGGYGRRELAPFSDVDLLFLHAGGGSAGAKQFVERVLYLLWDMGLTVGQSFRSVKECLTMARNDLPSRNAMAEARLITGNAHMFRKLIKELDNSAFKLRRETEVFFQAMTNELQARYEKFGSVVCMQEPNVKESAGGLRDLRTALWVGHARYGAKSLDDLRADDRISGAEYSTARRAYDFIFRARNEAHFSTGCKTDLLTLDLQPQVAAGFGYEPKRGLMASEIFMRDYYQRANELHRFAESFLARSLASQAPNRKLIKRVAASFESRQGKLYLTIKRGTQKANSDTTDFEIRQGRLYFTDEPDDLGNNPMRLMEIFSVAQSERAALGDELKAVVRSQLHLATRSFRASKEAGRAFLEILRRRGHVAATLRAMHETGFLSRMLPEFARITFLVQHDFYHKYTIDEHTLVAIEALDRLAEATEPRLLRFVRTFEEVKDAAPLYLSLLLHDIGKGRGSGHAARGVCIAERVCGRLSLDREGASQVLSLIKEHLLMSHTSQRRDISEDGLIENFVQKVGDLDRLNMLLLLTYADISGVGPGVWSDWKGALLWELYSRARAHFTDDGRARFDKDRRVLFKQQVIRELLPEFLPSEVERHFAMMPERYQRAYKPMQVARHIRLISRLDREQLATDWRMAPGGHCSDLTVCARDQSGLIARIAGALTAHSINILSADVNTREDGLIIDTFKVCELNSAQPVREELHSKVEQNLRAALEDRYDVAEAVERWRERSPRRVWRERARKPVQPAVRFDSEISAAGTVVEVRAEDEPGLVYKIASAIAALDFSIALAKISTEKSHALDVFYITNARGQKLGSDEMAAVEAALLKTLGRKTDAKSMKEAV